MIYLLLINLTPEAQCMAWRAAQRVWGGAVAVQSTDVQTALALIRRAAPFERAPAPSLALIAAGSHDHWDPEALKQLREELKICGSSLLGLVDTSRAMEQLRARHAPLDGILLSPVRPEVLAELAGSLARQHLRPSERSSASSA